MTIELSNETTLSLAAAARMLPPGRRGRPVSLSCLLRWVIDGVKLPSGEVVRLEAVRLGGRWLTSVQALERFAERQTPRFSDQPKQDERTDSARQRASKAAGKKLAKSGW